MSVEVNQGPVLAGLRKGLSTTWELAQVIIPTTIVVTILRTSGFLEWLGTASAPYMEIFGLSGDAALVLFSGYVINLYAAVGSIIALELPAREIAIIAVMLGFAHSLLIELAISKKAGSPISYIFAVRFGLSLISGVVMGGLL